MNWKIRDLCKDVSLWLLECFPFDIKLSEKKKV